MSTALTNIFGVEIKVVAQPRQLDRQYVGFAGAGGVTSMNLGTRGRQLIVSGRLRASGGSYSAARGNLQDKIDDIEAYLTAEAAGYTYEGETYKNVVFDRLTLVERQGRYIHYTSAGEATADFVCFLRQLI